VELGLTGRLDQVFRRLGSSLILMSVNVLLSRFGRQGQVASITDPSVVSRPTGCKGSDRLFQGERLARSPVCA